MAQSCSPIDGAGGNAQSRVRQLLALPRHRQIFGLHGTTNCQYVLGNPGYAYSLMKRGTRSGLRLALLLLLVGGVYLVMHNYEQQLCYAPSTFIKKTPRDAKLSFDNIALTTDDGVNIQG